MLKIVLIVALVAIAPSEAHLKKLLLKKAIAKHLLPSTLTEKLPLLGGGLGAKLAGGAGVGAISSEKDANDVADVAEAAIGDINVDVADPPQSSEVPVMPLPSVPVQCTADKPCASYYVPGYVLYPYYGGYYYPYPSYSYYPYYPYPYPYYYESSEHRTPSPSPAPSDTTW